MTLGAYPTTICHGNVSNSLPFIFGANYNSCNLPTNPNPTVLRRNFYSLASCRPLESRSPTRYLRVRFGAHKRQGSTEEDCRALDTVLELYAAIENKNVQELSDVIGDECCCVCNFISSFKPFHGKKQVLEFFSKLITGLGNNIEFKVQPTLHDGMSVGVSWRLECSKTHVPLGKGFSFYMLHRYQGKLVIRNVEMFLEPLLPIEPFRLKVMGFLMTAIEKLGLNQILERNERRVVMLGLVFMAALAFFLKPLLM